MDKIKQQISYIMKVKKQTELAWAQLNLVRDEWKRLQELFTHLCDVLYTEPHDCAACGGQITYDIDSNEFICDSCALHLVNEPEEEETT